MTEPRPGAEDPLLIVHQLRADIESEDVDTTDGSVTGSDAVSGTPSAAEAWGENLAGRTADYPAVVQAAADLCIPAAEVTPGARKRFIGAAERALAARRARVGLLPVALADARRRAGLSLVDVQVAVADAGFDADIADLEAGRRTVRDAEPAGAAAWIFAVGADQVAALASYRRSLEADNEGELRPAAGVHGGGSSVDDLVAQAAEALDQLNRRSR